MWYNDGNTSQWVDANSGVPGPKGQPGPSTTTMKSPSASENVTAFFARTNLTLSHCRAVVRGSSPSVTYSVRTGSDRSASGTLLVNGATVTSTTTGTDATLASTSITANTWVWVTTSATSGTVNELAVALEFS